MALFDYSHRKALLLGLGMLILAFVFPTVFGVLFPASREVSWDAGIDYSTCTEFLMDAEGGEDFCTTEFAVTIGNTGKEVQERITVTLDPLPADLRVGWSMQDIVATSVQSARAELQEDIAGQQRTLVIENLAPNRLIEFSYLARGVDSRTVLESVSVTVYATGRVIHSTPRLTVVSRFVKNLFGVFGV